MAVQQRPSYLRSLYSYSKKDKPRLYVALYPRGSSDSSFVSSINCDSYHWALVVGPQTASRKDPGTRYHVLHASGSSMADSRKASVTAHAFIYNEDEILSSPTAQDVLVRITVAKVLDGERLATVMRSLPVPPADDHTVSCLTWVRQAFEALHADGCLKSYLEAEDWREVEECARKYCKRKRDSRRFTDADGPWDLDTVSTWNFWENRQTMP